MRDVTLIDSQKSHSGSSGSPSVYWMRSVSFAGLHRILHLVADSPLNALRPAEIDTLVRERGMINTFRGTRPARTTVYHYRNTLLRLRMLRRDGAALCVNNHDSDVKALVTIPCADAGSRDLPFAAWDHFASLILRNHQCRSLFFDLFMPLGEKRYSLPRYRKAATPVTWRRSAEKGASRILFHNEDTGRIFRCMTPVSLTAIPYGLRYWARDEVKLVDEYFRGSDGATVMFPVSRPSTASALLTTIRWLLARRGRKEWKSLSISDAIVRYCTEQKLPRRVLFDAITRLRRRWPHHVVLIPTSPSLATVAALSPKADDLALRNYYKASDGRYISHIRIHQDVTWSNGEDDLL